MIYLIDIDNTLCETFERDYSHSQPYPERIAAVNKLYDEGHTIKITTGRGSASGMDWEELTKLQLRQWGLKYHELIMGKPVCDVIIDDIAVNADDYFNKGEL